MRHSKPKKLEEMPVTAAPAVNDQKPVLDLLVAIHSTLIKIHEVLAHPKTMVTGPASEMMVIKEHPFANGKGKILDMEPVKTAKQEVVEAVAPPKEDGAIVPLSALRETASKFAAKFGQQMVLDLIVQYGDVRKLSEVPEEKRNALETAFREKLLAEDEEEPVAEEAVTLDQVKQAAQKFIADSSADAFKDLLKAFGAAKLSEVKAEKYAALYEALTNV